MQRQTLNLTDKVRGGFQGLSDLASTIALPKEHPPVRVPTFPNLERTSVLSFERTASYDVGVVATSSPGLRCALTRIPSFPFWVDRVPTDYSFATENAEPSQDTFDPAFECVSDDAVTGFIGGFEYVLIPHSIDVGSSSTPLLMSTTDAATALTVNIEVTDGERRETYVYYVTSVEISIAVTAGLWMRVLSMQHGAAGGGRVQFRIDPTFAGLRYLLPAGMPLEITHSDIPYRDSRCTANAALFSNTTKVMNKEGTVIAARLRVVNGKAEATAPWKWTVSQLSSVHPSERYYGPLEKGSYSYTAPTEEVDSFSASSINRLGYTFGLVGTARYVGVVDIPKVSMFNALYFEEVVGNVSQLAVTNTYHLEFRSTSSLFNVGFSAIPLESYHAAQLALLSTGYFFENPLHMAALASLLLRGIKSALPIVAPHLINFAKSVIMPRKSPKISMKQAGFAPAQKRKQAPPPRRRRRKRVVQKRKK